MKLILILVGLAGGFVSAAALALTFVSVAYSPVSGAHGAGSGVISHIAARDMALAACGDSTCQEVAWVEDGCAALAVDAQQPSACGYATIVGFDTYELNDAASGALSRCDALTPGACSVVERQCSDSAPDSWLSRPLRYGNHHSRKASL